MAGSGLDLTVVLIRERIDLEKLFAEFVELKGRGAERMAFCVFHENKDTPALSINVEEGLFRCMNPVCGERGDFIDFYRRVRSLTFKEALNELARRCGIPEPVASTDVPRTAKIENPTAANDELLAQYAAGRAAEALPKDEKDRAVKTAEVDRVIDEQIVEAMHFRLQNDAEQMLWLKEARGITAETVSEHQIGHDGQRFYIPVRDAAGNCVNIRRYNPNATQMKMISWREGFGKARLFPLDKLQDGIVYLLEGEWDCLLARQLGLNALTTTAGAGTWLDAWNPSLEGRDIIICYDCDEAGRKGARVVATQLSKTAATTRIVELPLDEEGADFTDYIVKHGKTVDDFLALAGSAQSFQASDEALTLPEIEPISLHLSQASKADYHNLPVRFGVMVSGKTTSPYLVPRIVRNFCPNAVRGTMDMCKRCPVNKAGGPMVSELKFTNNDVLMCIGVTDAALKRTVKSQAGIPSKCVYANYEVLKAMNVEEVQLIPEVERTDANAPYVTTSAYYLGHGLQANRSYIMTGVTVPEPKRQLATHIISSAIQSQSNIEAFRLTDEVISRLGVFRPTDEGAEGLWKQLAKVYEDLERHTRIYQRRDVMLAVDLVFHSVLQFYFQGERLKRGWTEALIIGDSRTGKTSVAQRLQEYYGAGEFSTGENTTLAGLVGGLHNVGTSWALQWGRIPLNDGRLLIIDEAGNLPPEQISRMSSMRSSGVAEVIKVHTERTNARTRQIWISNPRSNRPLSSFSQGVLAVKELIGAPEDVARFDIVASAVSADVPLAVVNAAREQEETQTFTAELCHQRVMWAWSRKAEHITFEPAAASEILDIATRQGDQYRYATEIPLVEPNEQRVKLARLAVAAAAMFFSASADGQMVIVKPEHVKFVVQYLESLYAKPSLSFAEYAQNQRARYIISGEDTVERILRKQPSAAKQFMEQENFTKNDVQEILGVNDKDELRNDITALRECGFLRRQGSTYYQKTPAAIRWLRSEISGYNGQEEHLDFSELMEASLPSKPDF